LFAKYIFQDFFPVFLRQYIVGGGTGATNNMTGNVGAGSACPIAALDLAGNINDLRCPPSNHLEELSGWRKTGLLNTKIGVRG